LEHAGNTAVFLLKLAKQIYFLWKHPKKHAKKGFDFGSFPPAIYSNRQLEHSHLGPWQTLRIGGKNGKLVDTG